VPLPAFNASDFLKNCEKQSTTESRNVSVVKTVLLAASPQFHNLAPVRHQHHTRHAYE
jgi:hypothetical protein